MADPKMVVVDGVRYRPEDAPKSRESAAEEPTATAAGTDSEHKMRKPKESAGGGSTTASKG